MPKFSTLRLPVQLIVSRYDIYTALSYPWNWGNVICFCGFFSSFLHSVWLAVHLSKKVLGDMLQAAKTENRPKNVKISAVSKISRIYSSWNTTHKNKKMSKPRLTSTEIRRVRSFPFVATFQAFPYLKFFFCICSPVACSPRKRSWASSHGHLRLYVWAAVLGWNSVEGRGDH